MHRNVISSKYKEGNESFKMSNTLNALCMVIVRRDVFHYDEMREIEMFVFKFLWNVGIRVFIQVIISSYLRRIINENIHTMLRRKIVSLHTDNYMEGGGMHNGEHTYQYSMHKCFPGIKVFLQNIVYICIVLKSSNLLYVGQLRCLVLQWTVNKEWLIWLPHTQWCCLENFCAYLWG